MLFTLVSVITSGTGAALLAKWADVRRGSRPDQPVPAGEPLRVGVGGGPVSPVGPVGLLGPGGPGLSPGTVLSSR